MRIGYARVSTTEQNLDLQLNALVAAGCDVIFEDEGFSGAITNRPGLTKALRRLKRGDTLIVWRLDRLGRSLIHLVKTVTRLQNRGVEFLSLTESMDTGNPAGALVFHIFAALAEFERRLISERSAAGIAAAKAKGRLLGRRPSLTQEQIADVYRAHFQENLSLEIIALQYRVHPRTVRRHLRKHVTETVVEGRSDFHSRC
ncbi:recombinase family protein [Neorhizobium galegae]|uniref:Putative DNA-invertase n=1 Tax=Neorhizobium galegae bv. orientalis str. HAMBI 540 TaxID=1028800 RepID=A0A068SNA2_NEOGA|nr:recombinase family protein [Neorhizobium galegae]CDN46565.1 Putative DNA-invertase [Neorhizobium galegae bv. orientalis str. HAMBI 540]